MIHSVLPCATPAPEFLPTIRQSFSRNFSRPTIQSPARKAAPGWGLRSPSASSRCTAEKSGWNRRPARARPSGSHSPSRSSSSKILVARIERSEMRDSPDRAKARSGLLQMRDRRDLDQKFRAHQIGPEPIARRWPLGKIFAIDLVHGSIVRHVGKEDMIEGDVPHRSPGGFEYRLDGLEHMARLRLHVTFADQIACAVERECARHVDGTARLGARRIRRKRRRGALRNNHVVRHRSLPLFGTAKTFPTARALKRLLQTKIQNITCGSLTKKQNFARKA